MSIIYVMETHDQRLKLWLSKDVKGRSIAHLDFDCDRRGLWIDRQDRQAYSIADFKPID